MIMELFEARKDQLPGLVGSGEDIGAIADSLVGFLDALKGDYYDAEPDRRLRGAADALFDAAKRSVSLLLSANRASVTVEPAPPVKGSWRLLRQAPGFVMDIVAAWLLLEGQSTAALVVLVAAIFTHVVGFVERPAPVPRVKALPQLDAKEAAYQMERLVRSIDQSLEGIQTEREAQALPAADRPLLEGDVWDAVQMLYEASATGDGDYALKALPQLDAALAAQGVEAVPYAPEVEGWFETFPTMGKERTIRPAMVKDGKLLVRGQATRRPEDDYAGR